METEKDPAEQNVSEKVTQVVSFALGEEIFGLDILRVQEIIRPMEITHVPNAPASVEGVINLRGRVIPVVDLRKRFGLPVPEDDSRERIIVLKREPKPVGLIVDAVSEVLRFPREALEEAPEMVSRVEGRFLTGVAKVRDRLVLVLDPEAVAAD